MRAIPLGNTATGDTCNVTTGILQPPRLGEGGYGAEARRLAASADVACAEAVAKMLRRPKWEDHRPGSGAGVACGVLELQLAPTEHRSGSLDIA